MASRRPPLFELLQQDEGSRQGRSGTGGRSGALSGNPSKPSPQQEPEKASNGHASGAMESKPSKRAPAAPVQEITAPTTEPQRADEHSTQVNLKPRRAEPQPKPERPAGAADWSGMHPQSSVRVRMLWVYVAIFAVLTIVVGVWALGYNLGERNQKAKLGAYLDRAGQTGPIRDPLGAENGQSEQPADPTPLAGLEHTDQARRPERPPVVQPDPPAVEPKRQTEPVRPVDVLVDVREAGNNYLKLASGMTRQRAVGLAQHLVANGVPAMAIDDGRGSFGLYTAFAVPSGQYRSMGDQRRDLEARVVRLLGSTPQELGGPYTPRDQLWMRFDG